LSLLLRPIAKLQKLYADHRTDEAEAVYMLEPDRFALTLHRSARQRSEPRISRGAIVETIKAPKAWLSLLEKPSDIRLADRRD
jgi:hypothetical protein